MKKKHKEELIFLNDNDIKEEYDIIKLSDTCKDTFKIQSIKLPKEYEEKMPLLRKIYPPKKKILKRR